MEHTHIKFDQQPANYGSWLAWDIAQGLLAVTCFAALITAIYIIATH
jgi:hypothetical protein